MRDAAGELADRLHLLRLAQLLLRPLSASCASRRSVMSRVILAKPSRSPSLSWIASITTLAQNCEPSLRTRRPSASNLPSRTRRLEGARRHAGGAVGFGVEAPEMLADDLACAIALDALGAGVPVGDDAVGVEHVDRVVAHALDQMLEAALGALALGGLLDQPRIGRRKLRRAHADLAFQALLALPQRLFDAPPARDLVLRGAVEPGLVDRDRGLDGDGRHDALGAIVEHAGLGMAEEQPAQHLAGARDHRHREIAAHRQMALRHAEIGRVLAVARILGDVGRAHDALAAEGGREHRGVARHRELGERFARHAGQGVERVGLALVVDHVVEERAEGRA